MFGRQPSERSDPVEFLASHNVRVVIDVSDDTRDAQFYQTLVVSARIVLIRLPINSRNKLGPAVRDSIVRTCRVLSHVVEALRESRAAGDPKVPAVFLCDSRGGGTAALLGIALVSAVFSVNFEEASAYVTRCWQTKRVRILSERAIRMFPEGDWLKEGGRAICNALRQQPIAQSVSSAPNTTSSSYSLISPEHEKILTAHGVLAAWRALSRVCMLDSRLMPYPLPFDTGRVMTVVMWLTKTHDDDNDDGHLPNVSSAPKRTFSRRVSRFGDDDSGDECNDDDDDDSHCHRRGSAHKHRDEWD